ncbi:MAG TPA: 2-C-methyl-D-erythritol 4-phosphate cytidylyltransferase [Puia sp.]|nr:2-C-methyl-D-erythritol 4-phosphate cytidylyltransferase [Puia sp.]
MKKYAVIVAAGAGLRMGGSVPKQFLLLQGKPLLWHTLRPFLQAFDDLEVILVLPDAYMEEGRSIAQASPAPGRIRTVKGGITRYQSVKNGLALVEEPSVVFVHDGVRCLVTTALIHRCYDAALREGNAIPVMTSTDSIRILNGGCNEAIDRDRVKLVQTPQTFLSDVLQKAFAQATEEFFTDEASVVERSGVKIQLVEGEETNIKITRPLDLLLAEKILEDRTS